MNRTRFWLDFSAFIADIHTHTHTHSVTHTHTHTHVAQLHYSVYACYVYDAILYNIDISIVVYEYIVDMVYSYVK